MVDSHRHCAMLIVQEKYPATVKDNLIPLSDGAGVVTAVGPNAHRFKVGDNVMPACLPAWTVGRMPEISENISLGNRDDGVLRDFMLIEEQGLVRMPANYNHVQASTLPCAALTAWNALFGLKSKAVMPGDWVLTEGTGGVSLFAIQVRAARGSRTLPRCAHHWLTISLRKPQALELSRLLPPTAKRRHSRISGSTTSSITVRTQSGAQP